MNDKIVLKIASEKSYEAKRVLRLKKYELNTYLPNSQSILFELLCYMLFNIIFSHICFLLHHF